jgi:hypothetical protein
MQLRQLCLAVAFVSAALSAASSLAGEKTREVGLSLATLSGMKEDSHCYNYDFGGESCYSSSAIWSLTVPGNSFLSFSEPGLYASFRIADRMSFEPQAGFIYFREEDSATILNVAAQVNASLRSWHSKTPYLFGRVGLAAALGDGSDVETILGGGIGYRVPLRGVAVLRWEAYYNRYLDAHTNQFGARVKIGVLF